MKNNIEDTLAKIREKFLVQLPAKLVEIHKLIDNIETKGWQTTYYEKLYQLLHNLVGSTATFNLPDTAEASRHFAKILVTKKDPKQQDNKLTASLKLALIHIEKILQNELANTETTHIHSSFYPVIKKSPLIYLVEDDIEQAKQLINILEQANYCIRHFADLSSFKAALKNNEQPDAIIMDMIFPEGGIAGAAMIDELYSDCLSRPPVLFLSIRNDIDARLAAYRAGSNRYMTKPVIAEKLIHNLNYLTNRTPDIPYRVLLVDDDELLLESQANILRHAGMSVQTEHQPRKVIESAQAFNPEILVLDVYMPDVSGCELAALLRDDEQFMSVPIIFLSTETDMTKQLMALNLGGDYFLEKPVVASHLVSAVSTRVRRYRELRDMNNSLKHTLYEQQQEHLALNHHTMVSIADAAGIITYVNERFCQTSGYQRSELLGKKHHILKSDKNPEEIYQQLWQTINNGNVWQGELCNQSKNGNEYWVDTTIVPFLDKSGSPYQYISIKTDITQVKKLQQQANSSSERLRRSQIFANIGTWDWNIISGELFWSDRVGPILGYSANEQNASYEHFLAAIHPDDLQLVTDAIDACINQGAEYNIEHRVIWPNGQIRWVLEKGDIIRSEDGSAQKMLGMVTDIHNQKIAVEALRESEEKYRLLFELSEDPMWMIIKNNFKIANHAAAQLLGYKSTDLLANTHPSQLSPLVQDDGMNSFDKANKMMDIAYQEGYHRFEWKFKKKDGIEFPVDVSMTRVPFEGQDALFCIWRDISEQKEAEKNLKIFQRIFDSTEQGICVANAQGEVVYSNMAHDKITGIKHENIIGKHFEQFFSSDTKSWAVDVIMDEISMGKGWSGLLPAMQPDGTELMTLSNIGFIADDNGKVQYLFNIMRDYTDEQKRQQQLQKAKEMAEQASQAKSEFLSNMSHELRTPLNAILGFAQILEFDVMLDKDQKDSVNEVIKAGKHLLELINDLLDLARIESGRVDLSLEPIKLNVLVDECFKLIKLMAKTDGISVSYNNLNDYFVRADRTRLKQVLLNLLSNAIKYNREFGTVKLTAEPVNGSGIRITVSDSGKGIAKENIHKLFEPFNRLNAENSKIQGTGIGLSITHRIVEMMGGVMGVESEEGVGSQFWLELPLELINLSKQTENHNLDQATSNSDKLMSLQQTVLYIEDNPSNLKLVANILAKRKHINLLTAHKPELGINIAKKRQPDLILLDINMQNLNGYQVLDILKSDEQLKSIPVVAVTANAMPQDIKRGLKAGFSDYLTKPIQVANFLNVVDSYLSEK